MNIPKFFIKHWQFTICIFLLIAYWGIQSFLTMPKSEDPLFPVPNFSVVAVYPGASPDDMERLVVDPIERALGSLDQIDFIKTTVNDGVAAVQITFLQEADEKEKYNEVQREINGLQGKLPEGLTSIDVIQASTSKMAALNVSLQNVFNVIQAESNKLPGGYLDVDKNRYNVITNADYKTAEEITGSVVKSADGKNVHIADIATVKQDYEKQSYIGRYNGKKALFVAANQQDNTNIFDVTEKVEQLVKPYLNATAGIQIIKLFDQSESVSHRLDGLYRDFFIAIVLVLFTLLPLGTRASYVVMFAIPTSIFIGLLLLDFAGYSLNQFSIVGLVIALGLLVDDSIIVVENIVAKLRKGENKLDAAINGTNQLLPAILAVTTCIIFSFLPLVMLKGNTGAFIRSLPLAVVFTMLGSLFVSVSLTPLVSKLFLEDKIGDNRFYRAVMKLNEGPFLKMLHLCLRYPKTTLVSALLLVLIGFGLFKHIGVTFFPGAEKPQFMINATLPFNANTAAADSTARLIERELEKHPQIIHYATNIGKDNPQVYYNYPRPAQKAGKLQIFCTVKEYDRKETPALWDTLRTNLGRLPGLKIQVKEFIQGPPVANPIEIRILGDSTATLRTLAAEVEKVMAKIKGSANVDNPLREQKSEIRFDINRDKAAALAVNTAEIERTIRMSLAGAAAGTYTDISGNEYQIVIKTKDSLQTDLHLFDRLYVSSASGRSIPLSQVASYHFAPAVASIQHYNKNRSVTLTSDVKPGYLTNNVTNDILVGVKKIRLPANYSFQAGGEIEKRKESFGGLTSALFIAVFAIIAVLILAFQGIRGTLIVASAIPLGIFGAVVALWIGGYTFSFTAFIG
ncbi:MAG: efflux RND transporter permease subunit, partial [Pedobacter sp.]